MEISRATIISGARVLCMDDAATEASAVAWERGRIVAVGDESAVSAAVPGATVLQANGGLVIPGFVDAHHHVSIAALYGGQVALDDVEDIPALQERLAAAAELGPNDRWLIATDWDEGRLRERRPPTRAELDDAVGDRPLFAMHYTCHRAVANSRALELAGIDASTPDPSGGVISRGRGSEPNGLLIERGMSPVEACARASLIKHDAEAYLDRMAVHYRKLLSVGITRVADTTVPLDLIGLYSEAAERGLVLVPTIVCPVSAGGWLQEPTDVLNARLAQLDAPLSWGPVKLVFDGAPGCSMCMSWWTAIGVGARTALLTLQLGSIDPIRTSMSIAPRFGTQVRSGISIYEPAAAIRVVRALTENGFGVATHAIGNAAIDVALQAYEAAGSALHNAGVARLEHASFMDDALLRRVAAVGASVVAQPDMIRMPAAATAVPIRGMPFFALRGMLDVGVKVAGSSDYPVTDFDPLDGVRSAVNRLTSDGRIREPEERITVREALRMYTREGADVCGCLDETGTIEVGKRADFVVLDGEIEAPQTLRLRQTILDGHVAWERD